MVGHNINVKLFFQGAFIIGNLKCSVMPERFYQASTLLNTYGPRLKDCRGDGRGVIGPFRSERQGAIEPFRGDNLPPPSCLSAFIRHLPPPTSFPKSSIGNPRFCFFFYVIKYKRKMGSFEV